MADYRNPLSAEMIARALYAEGLIPAPDAIYLKPLGVFTQNDLDAILAAKDQINTQAQEITVQLGRVDTVETDFNSLIENFEERIYLALENVLSQGSNITFTKDPATNRITISSTGGGGGPTIPRGFNFNYKENSSLIATLL